MEEINKLRTIYGLKKVERANSVSGRKESPAEHIWSCLILADYFMSMVGRKLDRLKVYELLMYHDLVEIETGDVNLLNGEERKNKKEKEAKAVMTLKKKIPGVLGDKLNSLFKEYEAGKTKEARFARAVDALDAELHELDYKEDWKGWTEEFLRRTKGPLFEEFPEIKEAFEKTLAYCREKGYFEKKNENQN